MLLLVSRPDVWSGRRDQKRNESIVTSIGVDKEKPHFQIQNQWN